MALSTEILAQAANQARGLAIDAVHACSSGHLGLPLGCAEVGAALFGNLLSYNPDEPRWINRDRFILSAGHGSMFLYSWLHLSGYALPLEEIKHFRNLNSRTPGHPEFHETVGVEATTGPLGQGVGNSVGFAISGQMAAARFNTPEHPIFDNHVVCIAGDGCMQEGVANEAVAFAGHQKLHNLILIYDSNDVTLDAMANKTQSENTALRFKALEWDVQTVDGHDMVLFAKAFNKAKKGVSGKPQLIIIKTIIGKGIPEVQGTQKAHGEGGAKFSDEARAGLGLPKDQLFFVSDEVRAYFADHKKKLIRQKKKWDKLYQAWRTANVEKAALLDSSTHKFSGAALMEKIPEFPAGAKMSGTRAAGKDILQAVASQVPLLISGSADLHGSTYNYIAADKDFDPTNRSGRNIRFGIREHAMAAMCNGIAYDGLFRPSCATFLVFADYCRPSIRIASLSHLPVIYIFTHDSIGVGEDGPTHQPVETVSALRLIPHFQLIRPADAEETAAAFAAAIEHTDGPTMLALTRQSVPDLTEIPVSIRRAGVLKGGYVAVQETAPLTLILMAAGSEVQLALAAAKQIGPGTRVVSMPSFERFDAQSAEYKEGILPGSCRQRVAIEAGVTALWSKYVGLDGKVVGIDRFGISGPAPEVFKALGITTEHLVEVAATV